MKTSNALTPAELQTEQHSGQPMLLIDVLPEDVFAERHIPGAKNLCVYAMSFLDGVATITGPNRDLPIVVYGEAEPSGASQEARRRLLEAGYVNVRSLTGGVQAWHQAGLPLEGQGSHQPPPLEGTCTIDTLNSQIGWVGRNVANKHWGTLRFKEGTLEFNAGQVTGGRLVIDMTSMSCLDLADPQLNQLLIAHLQSSDFFETATYPEAVVAIQSAAPIPTAHAGFPNTHLVAQLTLHGRTAPVEFDAVVARTTAGDLVAQADFEIDRTRWNIRYGSGRFFERLGQHLVNDLLGIELKVVVPAQSPSVAT